MDKRSIEQLELNKILSAAAEYAVSEDGKELVCGCVPSTDIGRVEELLSITAECDKLLFTHGVGKIEQFVNVEDELARAEKGSVLSCKELLDCAALMRSARIAFENVNKISDGEIIIVKSICDRLYFDTNLENDIYEKIISQDAVSDFASEKLYSIRTKIKNLNERIRSTLSEYVSGKNSEFLQDSIVTIRNDRYVIPVKSEHKSKVRGFVHDRSRTGATFFIEPELVLELNNELISLTIDEHEEVEAVLKELSGRTGAMKARLLADAAVLAELDCYYAKAEYCYSLRCSRPSVNKKGYLNIIKGRHPLIDAKKVVPVTLQIGSDYNFLLLSGANTGGKTVTLKMCGLFCLMAACGFFIPAVQGSSVAVFSDVFCDVGDSQSIEESLSTFSSHITNVIKICDNVKRNSFVLIDELGGGTNPDEGQAIAKAVLKHLLESGCKGIITTHFTPLKEYAYEVKGVENASMEFDYNTLKPLYRIKIGLPGASNALAISRRLGMDAVILEDAATFLSEGARSFENVVRMAEESRLQAENALVSARMKEVEWNEKVVKLNEQIEELNREREKLNRSARVESRRIIAERTERAENILAEIEEIFKKEEISEAELIRARTLKNKLKDTAYDEEEKLNKVEQYVPADLSNLKKDIVVFVKPMESKGRVLSFSPQKGEAEVLCGSIKMHLKFKDLLIVGEEKTKQPNIKVRKDVFSTQPVLEINVLGLTVGEALFEVDNFIDRAVTDNLEEIKVIHGVGTGKLKKAISEHLKRHKNVESFRLGNYGEGETGVTFIKLK